VEPSVRLAEQSTAVKRRLGALLPAADDPPQALHQAMRYACLAGGKFLRPAFCIASCAAAGGDPATALDAACALEMVHSFSLIHDDLPALDDDDMRRGMPSCHKAFGEAVAILAGDALFALAFQTLAASSEEPKIAAMAVSALAEAASALVRGETRDLQAEGKSVSTQELQTIHQEKTAALFAASCAIGGLMAAAPAPTVSALKEFGQRVGLAFQIADDILNETSTPEQLGKAVGSDRARGKSTYSETHGVERASDLANAEIETAIQSLAGLSNTAQDLRDLARFTISRKS